MPGGGGGGDKAVRLSFVVDEASLAQARSAIDGLISKAADLARVLSSTHIGGGPTAAPGGGGMSLLSGGAVGGTSTSAQQLIQSAKPIQVGGLSAQLSQGLVAQKQLLTDLARGSSDAMRAMTDALGRAIDEEKRKLEGLQSTLKDTVDAYNAMGDAAKKGTGGGDAFQRMVAAQAAVSESKANLEVLQTEGHRATLYDTPEQRQFEAERAGGGGGSRGGRLRRFLTNPIGGNGLMGGLVGAMGWGTAIAGIYGAASAYAGGSAMMPSQEAAARANVFSPLYQRAMQGDITDVLATRATSTGVRGGDAADLTGGSHMLAREGIGIAKSGVVGALTSDVGMNAAIGTAPQTAALRDRMQMQENWKQENFKEVMAAQMFTGGAQSHLAMGRALGIGWSHPQASMESEDLSLSAGQRRRLGPAGVQRAEAVLAAARTRIDKGNASRRAAAEAQFTGGGTWEFEANLMEHGYDMGQYMGAFSPIQGIAGRRAAQGGGLTWQAMAAQATGMGNAATVAGQAALGGQGKQFMGEVYGAGYGRGGDATAAGALGGVIGSGIGSSGIYGSGLGALGAFNFFGAGASGTDQMKNVAFAQAGLGVMGSVSSGQFDPYQRGLNYVNAKKAGVGSVAGSDFLATLKDPKLLMDAMRGKGETFDEATALGIDKDQLRKYAQATIMSPLSRVFTGAFRDKSGHLSAAGSTAESLQLAVGKGESGQQWLLEQERGARVKHGTKAGHAFEMKKVTELGAALSESMGIDSAAGKGLAESMLGMGASGKTGGPGGVSGPELKEMQAKAKMLRDMMKTMVEKMPDFISATGDLSTYAQAWVNDAQNLGIGANEVTAQFARLSGATEELIAIIHGANRNDIQKYRNRYGSDHNAVQLKTDLAADLKAHPEQREAIQAAADEQAADANINMRG